MFLTALAIAAALPQAAGAPPPPATATAPQAIRTAAMTADLYLPSGTAPAPAILLLGGSEGGLSKGVARQATLLAARGYAVLHLSYFGSPGQPAALKAISIETFTRALDWLKAQPRVAADRVGIIGTSKGAEAALIVATRRPDLRIAVLGVPSSVVWPGIDGAGMVTESSWTEGNRPLAFTPYGWTGTWKGIHALYADGLADATLGGAGTIPAERARAAIVMVCGEADGLWPSCPMARAVEKRVRAGDPARRVTLLAYQDAGHAAFGPPIDPAAPGAASVAGLGGTRDGNLAARADAWPKVLAALDAALAPGAAQ